MMQSLVAHRINTIKEINDLAPIYGLECDLRDHHGEVVLHHDPFIDRAESFNVFCQSYKHGLLILNIKSEGIEAQVLKTLEKFSISNFVFLDSSFPMIIKHTRMGLGNFALRISDYEGLDTLKNMRDLANFAWMDSFGDSTIDFQAFLNLKKWGYKIILVSPDLHGRDHEIQALREDLKSKNLAPDFICTKIKNFDLWKI